MTVQGIENVLRHLVSISVNATLGNDKELKRLFLAALEGPVKLSLLEEVVLQTALFAGVPRALNAMRLLQDVLNQLSDESRNKHLEESKPFRKQSVKNPDLEGIQTFEKVYGSDSDRIRKVLAQQHDFFESWIVNRAYGEILSRPAMDLKTREVCAVSALVALESPVQLWGHLKGALRSGATAGELKAALSLISLYVDVEDASRMLERIDRS